MFRRFMLFVLLCISCCLSAMSQTKPFKGSFFNKENRVRIVIDLYEPTITTPNFEFFGKSNGYMNGNLYSTWFLTSFSIKGKIATLHFSNDQGADSQTVSFETVDDKTFNYSVEGNNDVKKVVGRKLVKIPSSMIFLKE